MSDFQLYHGKNKLHFDEMMMMFASNAIDQQAKLDFYSASSVSRCFGTKTFQHPLKKPVRHQEGSVSRQIGTRTNRHRIFSQTNMISFSKIKSRKVEKKHQ